MGKIDLAFTDFPCKDSFFSFGCILLLSHEEAMAYYLPTWPRPSTLCLFVTFTPLCSRGEIISLNSFNEIKLQFVFFAVSVICTLECLDFHGKGKNGWRLPLLCEIYWSSFWW